MTITRIRGGAILDGTITDADVATANKDGTTGTASLRTLGTGALQAAAGNHRHALTRYFIVDPAGLGDYTTINGALAACVSPGFAAPYVILCLPATYAENIVIPVYTAVISVVPGGAILVGSGHTGQMVSMNGFGSVLQGFLCQDTARTDSNYMVLLNSGALILDSVIHVEKAIGATPNAATPVSAVAITGNNAGNGPSLENCTLYARSDAALDVVYALWAVYANGMTIKDVTATCYCYGGGVSACYGTDTGSNVTYVSCRTLAGASNATTQFDFYVVAACTMTLQFCQYNTAGGGGTLNDGYVLANTKKVQFNAASGNAMNIAGNAANQLELVGGSGGSRIVNNAYSRELLNMRDTGEFILLAAAANGEFLGIFSISELVTVAAAAFTDTVFNIPASCIVLGIPVRVTVAIPTATTFSYTGATSGVGYGIANVPVAAGSTDPGTKSSPTVNGAAQHVRITPNATPATNAGRVRVTLFYYYIQTQTS